MGHQLLLTSSIPHSHYTQTVATLQALTGSHSPQTIATYTILTKPKNVFKPKFEPGKVNQIEQFYMKCTTVWNDDASKDLDIAKPVVEGDSDISVDRLFAGKEVKHWTLQIADIPNAGKNVVSAQNFYESTVVHHHTSVTEQVPNRNLREEANADVVEVSPVPTPQQTNTTDDVEMVDTAETSSETKDSFLQFLDDLGYGVVNQYWMKGIRFFQGDIVIEIFKIFVRDDDAPFQESKIKLQLLDDSNAFQIKAYISFPKGAGVDLINKGTKDLTTLQATLHNLFELGVPDRMCMDSRVARYA
ncbi:hypothetical protein HF325_004349 [Metschnikowia pulcherrima]|uniref:Mediator of RNA polymerase II transcription subunit 18 n=1 Tax=Metschnikowia pulcherrima TaxID=27326 RepID=A0A8H7GR64_9ASCO|nr:hypothetical protein HF325_004349 [Metschnikowia pulcherrima]